uniref:receptor protein-tyrosine kinase n=1 Tax=Ciona savignyi TaxID=51511 RepID=H2YZE2_CIOSA
FPVEILNTRNVTSDLEGWVVETYVNGWDELSFPIRNSTLRGFQICPVNNHRKKSDTQNWLRSPFMKLIGRSRIYIELNFSMRECHDLEDTICRETFKIYYAIANNGSRNPNLDENTFTTIDTVAAEDHFHPRKKGGSYINTEVVTVVMPASVDISSTGIYIALMDEGACMALISLRVYSIVCPSVTDSLAVFPETLTGQLDTSLVKVSGECVEHSRLAVPHRSLHPPVFHCTSDGKWNVQTGTCYCEAGYEPDGLKQRCQPCPRNSFKSSSGNENCTKCPGTSFTTGLASVTCMCSTGFNISSIDSADCGVCPTLPSAPLKLNVIKSTIHPGVVRLKWKKPADLGHCRNISYCAMCQIQYTATTDHSNSTFGKCNHVIYHPSQCTSDTPHINVHNLHGRTNYTFTVFAINSITERHYSNSISAIKTGLFTIHQKASLCCFYRQSFFVLDTSGVAVTFSISKYHPSTVRSLHLVQANYTSVDIEWNPPSYTNGDQVTYRVGAHVNASSVLVFSTLSDASQTTRGHMDDPLASTYIYLIAAVSVLIFSVIIHYLLKYKIPLNGNNNSVTNLGTIIPTPHLTPSRRTYVDPFSIGPIEPHKFGCETDPNRVSIGKVIGCGEFGEVFRGTLTLKVIDVAIKQLHALCQPHEQIDFLHEAKALEQFQHPNIVKLEAVVTASRPFMIVTELMANGCLGMFLRHQRAAKRFFKPVVLIRMLYGVSEGMEYLSKLGYVHRDLAARNVLINKDLVCKVADFGLTRQINDHNTCTNTKGGKISLRWAAPEAVAYQTYSEASDVWSFGVFAWEVVTYGEKPYWSLTNQQVLQAINDYRLPAPEDCPSVLHQLMLECWHRDRNARPQFSRVVGRLDTMLNQRGMLDT